MKQLKSKKNKISTVIKILCLIAIAIWPLYNSFLGLDLVDTGYYLYQYDTPLSPYGTYTTYLATLIGAVWLKLFPELGLWGLNFLEILLEWLTCVILYNTFKNRFGKTTTLVGVAITMCGISTYVNIFNYHQLNMSLCCAMLCFMYLALSQNKNYLLVISGCFGALAITCRMPSILTLLCILCILYWNVWVEKSKSNLLKRWFSFISGYFIIGSCTFFFLYKFELLDAIVNEIFRLNNLSRTGNSTYGTSSMLSNLIRDTFWGILAALIFTACMLGFAAVYEWTQVKKSKRCLLLVLYVIMMLPVIYASIYIVGQAPSFIQLTSFSWFLYGMCMEICLYYMIKGIIKPTVRHAEEGAVAMMAIALILLCVVGSAARSKHVILGLWIIVPFVGHKIKDIFYGEQKIHFPAIRTVSVEKLSAKSLQLSFCIILVIASVCFGRFVIMTNNFDSTDRSSLTAKIDSNRVKFIRTTIREAEAVNGVLDVLKNQDRKLMVVGNGVGLYYLTGMESYIRPWVSGTSYTYEKFYGDLKERVKIQEKRPIVLVCKTNPYEGFSADNYENLKEKEEMNNSGGKKDLVFEFMNYYEYFKLYENDYFILYEPNSEREMEKWELW